MRLRAVPSSLRLSVFALLLAACGGPILGQDAGDAGDASRDVRVDAPFDARPDTVDVVDITPPTDAADVIDAADAPDAPDAVDAVDAPDVEDVTDVVEMDTGEDVTADAAPDAADVIDAAPDVGCTLTTCGTACVDLQTEPTHCGDCATDCTALPGVTGSAVTCVAGTCVLTGACATGRADCNSDPTDGCEVDLASPDHCGACGTVCAGTDDSCQTRTCTSGTCGMSFAAAGTALATQTLGDCRTAVCNGSGGVSSMNDDSDIASDANDCTTDTCSAGSPVHAMRPAGTACTQNGGSLCNAAGNCVQCNAPTDCSGTDGACSMRSCSAGICGVTFVPAGNSTSTQAPGDCHRDTCDGSGNVVTVVDDTDVPVDANQCTDNVCTAGVPSNPSSPPGTACTQSGGVRCNGAGACVGCIAASDCPGTDTECRARACTAGTCGFTFTAAGTRVSAQVPGNCSAEQCDGTGNVVSVPDNTDIQNDSNQCTTDSCSAGSPVHTPVSTGTSCTQNGGRFCSATATCVQCLSASDCPAATNECAMAACNAGVCGFDFAPSGTPATTQSPRDCQQRVCNGSGTIVSAPDNADIPVDGNACTSDVCTAGVPSNPPAPMGTACAQGSGVVCNGSGACVQCLAAADCPGVDTGCTPRSCTAGACGTTNAPAGTPTGTQTTGDCRSNVCNGTGGTTTANDDTDVPVDGNQCTNDVCTSGVPSNPPTATGTACSQSGGTVCNGLAACVQCNVGADCTSRVCVLNACQAPTCFDSVRNGTETDVDCGGGLCPACAVGRTCAAATDCANGLPCANSVCTQLLLSEVQTRGSAGGNDEFIEIYNPMSVPVTFSNQWTVAARSAATTLSACASATTTNRAAGTGQTIPPHGHLLLVGSAYDGTAPSDATLSSGVTDASSVILRYTAGTTVTVADAVCFYYDATTQGVLTGCSTPYTCEGTPVSNLPHNNASSAASNVDTSIDRRPGGLLGNGQDTNDNATDFAVAAVANPQNLSSPATP